MKKCKIKGCVNPVDIHGDGYCKTHSIAQDMVDREMNWDGEIE